MMVEVSSLPQQSKRKYRPDIDGMRAVAVVLVVLFHLHMRRFRGGFIGVDVFFVISGYLISSVVLADMDAGRFSLLNFYERRIRRIFPALFALFFVVTAVVCWYLAPSEIVAYARSLLAALFSGSNVLFSHEIGYFDAPASLKPLLHTWSLGVEEQFYVFFPVFLVAVRRWLPRHQKAAICVVAMTSFALSCFWVKTAPNTAFYSAASRAWELLIGTLISQRYLPEIRGHWQRNIAAFGGLFLILIPAFTYGEVSFPGFFALLPCAGAALVIAAGETGSSVVGDLLALRPVVFIGLISYSLYLWHWPIIVFQDAFHVLVNRPDTSRVTEALVFAVSLAAAALSWRFIETPFREGPRRPGRRPLFLGSAITAAALVVVAVGLIASRGLMFLLPPVGQQYAAEGAIGDQSRWADWRLGTCFVLEPEQFAASFTPSTCLHMDSTRKNYLLLGDSHTAQLYPGLSTVFAEVNFSQITVGFGCRVLLLQGEGSGGSLSNLPHAESCRNISELVYGPYLERAHFDTVVLADKWDESAFPDLARTITWFKQRGTKVIVVGPNVAYDVPLPTLLVWSVRRHSEGIVRQHLQTDPRILDAQMKTLAGQWGASYISSYEDLCGAGTHGDQVGAVDATLPCPLTVAPGMPMLFDTNHFTVAASVKLAETMRTLNQFP